MYNLCNVPAPSIRIFLLLQITKMTKFRTQRQHPVESKVEQEAEPLEVAEYGTLSKVSLLDQHSELKKKAEGVVYM